MWPVLFRLVTGKMAPESLALCLFSNARVPTPNDDASDYVEVRGAGYKRHELTADDWTVSDSPPEARAEEREFAFTGEPTTGRLVYGWFLKGVTSGRFYVGERFDATKDGTNKPYPIEYQGDKLAVVARMVRPGSR